MSESVPVNLNGPAADIIARVMREIEDVIGLIQRPLDKTRLGAPAPAAPAEDASPIPTSEAA